MWADFGVIASAFVGFAVAGILLPWPLVWVGGSFVVFVATSGLRSSMYDPLGRYIGGLLMAAALAVLLAQDLIIERAIEWTVAIACLATMAARLAYVVHRAMGAMTVRQRPLEFTRPAAGVAGIRLGDRPSTPRCGTPDQIMEP